MHMKNTFNRLFKIRNRRHRLYFALFKLSLRRPAKENYDIGNVRGYSEYVNAMDKWEADLGRISSVASKWGFVKNNLA